ncbi:MAG: PHP domain-containing protein [Clostridia bacterium]|jgi:hypothetical protein|nr:PHP domain-containing protein [Clostridia bacterium]MBT7121541.1 PHP domain-containing protein [Clostridia bacterium]
MRLYQFETHCHTAESSNCAAVPGAQAVDAMKQAGYIGTFITDHFYSRFFNKRKLKHLDWEVQVDCYLEGYKAAASRGDEIDFKVFLGMEVQAEDSPFEYLVYGPDEAFIKRSGPFYKLSTPELYALMHDNGFLMFQAHPFRFGLSPENPKYYDGIEIVNSQERNDSRNKRALEFAKRNKVLTIAGSDVHVMSDIGKSGIMLPGSIGSTQDFVDYYKEVEAPELIITYGI